MHQVDRFGATNMHFAPNARSNSRPRPLPQFLIANPRLEFSSNNRKQTHLRISNREPMAVSARNGNRSAGAIAVSASSQMAECWHQVSMATTLFRQQAASFHGDWCAGSSDPEMLIRNLENRKPPRKSGPELQKRRNTNGRHQRPH